MTAPLRHGVASDIGHRRVNEDSFVVQPPLYAIADGMGGHTAGDVASRAAVAAIQGSFKGGMPIDDAVREANREIFRRASANPQLAGMGTTVTAMFADSGTAHIVHVGDSRAYMLREGRLKRLTRDHSVAGRLVDQGKILPEEADRHPQRSVLERALGVEREVEVESQLVEAAPGDRFLLCTDGLTSVLFDDEIREVLEAETDPQSACSRLVKEALEAGTSDNVTVVVVDYLGGGRAAPAPRKGSWLKRAGLITLVLLAGGSVALGARQSMLSAWYVGDDHGRVAIFRGIPGSFGGLAVRRVFRRTDIATSQLTAVYRDRVSDGIQVPSRAQAYATIDGIRTLQASPLLPTPSPPPT